MTTEDNNNEQFDGDEKKEALNKAKEMDLSRTKEVQMNPDLNVWKDPDYSYYSFYSSKEFSLFCKSNEGEMSPPLEGLTAEEAACVENVKTKLNFFTKTYENSKGGCGCNRQKRVDQAVTSYCSLIGELSTCEAALRHVKSLLNSVEKIHFWKDGQRYRHFFTEDDPKFIPAEAPYKIL